jgi:hypothetical protein
MDCADNAERSFKILIGWSFVEPEAKPKAKLLVSLAMRFDTAHSRCSENQLFLAGVTRA